jgi:hypothetical protein
VVECFHRKTKSITLKCKKRKENFSYSNDFPKLGNMCAIRFVQTCSKWEKDVI